MFWLDIKALDISVAGAYAFRALMESGRNDMPIHTFKVPGPVGATRERGREFREKLEDLLRKANPGDIVEIDITEPEALSVSFSDELIGRLLAARAAGDFQDRAVIIVGASEDTRETIEAVLQRRNVPGVYRDSRTNQIVALAGASWFPETLRQASGLRASFRATELGEKLGLSPQAANNRLRALTTSGALVRERITPDRGGKEFEYRVAFRS